MNHVNMHVTSDITQFSRIYAGEKPNFWDSRASLHVSSMYRTSCGDDVKIYYVIHKYTMPHM
jgi:hypothetical protein